MSYEGDEFETPYECSDHCPVAGMMHVHPEDLDEIARAREVFRQHVTCGDCDMVYVVGKGWTYDA